MEEIAAEFTCGIPGLARHLCVVSLGAAHARARSAATMNLVQCRGFCNCRGWFAPEELEEHKAWLRAFWFRAFGFAE